MARLNGINHVNPESVGQNTKNSLRYVAKEKFRNSVYFIVVDVPKSFLHLSGTLYGETVLSAKPQGLILF